MTLMFSLVCGPVRDHTSLLMEIPVKAKPLALPYGREEQGGFCFRQVGGACMAILRFPESTSSLNSEPVRDISGSRCE